MRPIYDHYAIFSYIMKNENWPVGMNNTFEKQTEFEVIKMALPGMMPQTSI